MRKYSFILSAVAVTGLTVAAKAAPESTYWFDVRPTAASITTPANPFLVGQGDFPNDGGAGGGRGNGQILRLCPTNSTNYQTATAGTSYPNFDADGDASTGDLWLYTDVLPNADAPAGTGDVISSIGLDMSVATSTAATRYEIATVAWSWTLTDPTVPVNYGFANGTSSRTGVVGAKYVKVPVSGASLYATAGGLTPSATPYQLGKLRMQAAARGAVTCTTTGANVHAAASTYDVKLSVNNLLITRTFSTGGNATPEERVSFGYTGGALEADVSGNSVGGAGLYDAKVQVRMKGDTNGSGNVNGLDIGGFTTAQGLGTGITQAQRYLYDRNNSGNINGLDIGGFTGAQTAPCP